VRVLIVSLAVLASSAPGLAQYQGMTAEQCRRISNSQQQLTCLGQIRPPPPGQLSARLFSPVGLPAVIQPVAQPADSAPKASDSDTATHRARFVRREIAAEE
jgi:hypothetical protein